jgi:hypothetical protein
MIIVYAPYYCKEYYVSYCSGDAVANMFSYDMLLSLDYGEVHDHCICTLLLQSL